MAAPHWELTENGLRETQSNHGHTSRLLKICEFFLQPEQARGGHRTIRLDSKNSLEISVSTGRDGQPQYSMEHVVQGGTEGEWHYVWVLDEREGRPSVFRFQRGNSFLIRKGEHGQEEKITLRHVIGEHRRLKKKIPDEIAVFPRILLKALDLNVAWMELEEEQVPMNIEAFRGQLRSAFSPGTSKERPVELIPIVDADDQFITHVSRDTADEDADSIRRVTKIWLVRLVRDRTGGLRPEILLAQRALSKSTGAGMWGPAVAGTVAGHETYDSNVLKEAAEEIGLKPDEMVLMRLSKRPPRQGARHLNFAQHYLGVLLVEKHAKDFTLDFDEVANIRWIGVEELRHEIRTQKGKFGKGARELLEEVENMMKLAQNGPDGIVLPAVNYQRPGQHRHPSKK